MFVAFSLPPARPALPAQEEFEAIVAALAGRRREF